MLLWQTYYSAVWRACGFASLFVVLASCTCFGAFADFRHALLQDVEGAWPHPSLTDDSAHIGDATVAPVAMQAGRL